MKLTIRKKGNSYQLGFNYNQRWHNVTHLGTPKNLLKKLRVPITEEYQKLLNKNSKEDSK